jgi:hypothetical protein
MNTIDLEWQFPLGTSANKLLPTFIQPLILDKYVVKRAG